MKPKIPIVDFHSHILPNVDHGSSSLEESVKMLERAKKAGVVTVVATPHFYPGIESVDSFLERRNTMYLELKNYVAEHGMVIPSIVLGAEVAVEKGVREIEDLAPLCVGNTNYLLLEMPKNNRFYSWMTDFLYHVEAEKGLRVILAHVDRYDMRNTEKLLNLGFTAQINASALVAGRDKRILRRYCEDGLIHLIGSDAHDAKKRSYTPLVHSSKRLDDNLRRCFYDNSLEILNSTV